MKYLVEIIVICILLLCHYTINNIDDIISVFATSYISNLEPDGYSSKFNEFNYNGVKILYEYNISKAIPVLKEYIDDSKQNCEKIFNEVNVSLTIEFDYDKDVFLSRFESNTDNISAYYVDAIKTIYIYVDSYENILNNKENFSEILLHEISHYYFSEFLRKNNISSKDVPVWINEGIADYISNRISFLDYDNIEFIPFNNISTSNDWSKIKSGKQYIQSLYSINKIISNHSEDILIDLLLELKEYDFNIAFKNIVGVDFSSFEMSIKNDMEMINHKNN